ncbi:MAG: YdcF family protein [Flavobacteriia bacterium]
MKKYEVGIVLGGMFEFDNDVKQLSVRRGADRIWQALALYKKGKIKKILITGGSGYVTDRGLNEAKQLKPYLIQIGIPEKDIIIEINSKNTYENAVETKKILVRSYPHIKKCLLITSGQHMRRARAIFKKEGFVFDTFSTDLYTSPKRHYYWHQFIVPDVEVLFNWNGLIKEWFGYISYWFAGYL